VIGEMWFRGEVLTLLGWLEALPEGAKRHRPRLLLEHATALMWVGRLEGVESLVGEAERIVDAPAEGSDVGPPSAANIHRSYLLGYAAAVRAWRANLLGDSHSGIEFARRALDLLPDDPRPRTFAALCLGEALRTMGDLAAASDVFAEAAELGRSVGHVYGTLTAMVWQARVQAAQGRLREAEDSFRKARRFVTERGVGLLPAAGPAHLGMGALFYERNELEEAERELEEGISLAERTRELSNLVWGYVTLSRSKLARGDEDGALETAREADRVARTSGADL